MLQRRPTRSVLIPDSPAPAQQQPPAKSPSPQPSGIDAFPLLEEPGPGSQVRVTGAAGTGEDEEMAQFESAFPDLSGEVPYEQVSAASWPLTLASFLHAAFDSLRRTGGSWP